MSEGDRDGQRLDWMERVGCGIRYSPQDDVFEVLNCTGMATLPWHVLGAARTVRDALDQAMAKGEG